MGPMHSVTGNVIYWVARIATTAVMVALVLTALFYVGRSIYRAVRRLRR